MKIQSVIEKEDGGADVIIENITQEELKALLQAGFVALLERLAAEELEKKNVPALLRKGKR